MRKTASEKYGNKEQDQLQSLFRMMSPDIAKDFPLTDCCPRQKKMSSSFSSSWSSWSSQSSPSPSPITNHHHHHHHHHHQQNLKAQKKKSPGISGPSDTSPRYFKMGFSPLTLITSEGPRWPFRWVKSSPSALRLHGGEAQIRNFFHIFVACLRGFLLDFCCFFGKNGWMLFAGKKEGCYTIYTKEYTPGNWQQNTLGKGRSSSNISWVGIC